MAERVAIMKRVWVGEKITESVLPVGPRPARDGGPRLLVGTTGPKTVRSAAPWADGLAGISMDLDLDKETALFNVAREAWAAVGKPKPHLATSFWFALGEGDAPRQQVIRHLRHYMNWIPREYVDAIAPNSGWAGTEEELVAVLRGFAEIGTSEVHLIPTSTDIDQLRRVADLVGEIHAET
jgi:alkanesulfonate monooxygenase SsuD/methylene tetrahydromethanopterin reductase-like flavin-dependent oxidoreductase (luciferase family)